MRPIVVDNHEPVVREVALYAPWINCIGEFGELYPVEFLFYLFDGKDIHQFLEGMDRGA